MGKRGMRTKEPDGIVPERSQVADKVLDLAREDYGTALAIADATGIPHSLIMGLTFHTPIDVIRGDATTAKARPATSTGHGSKLRSFRLV